LLNLILWGEYPHNILGKHYGSILQSKNN